MSTKAKLLITFFAAICASVYFLQHFNFNTTIETVQGPTLEESSNDKVDDVNKFIVELRDAADRQAKNINAEKSEKQTSNDDPLPAKKLRQLISDSSNRDDREQDERIAELNAFIKKMNSELQRRENIHVDIDHHDAPPSGSHQDYVDDKIQRLRSYLDQ